MVFDIKNLDEIMELTPLELGNRRDLVQDEEQKKVAEQNRLLGELTKINSDLADLIQYNQKISEAIVTNATKEGAVEKEHYNSIDIIAQYIQLISLKNRDKFISELKVEEDTLLEILEEEPSSFEIYDLQMHILDLEYLSSSFLKKVIELELDANMFKLDLKVKALNHKNVDEEVIKRVLHDKFLDIRKLAAKIAEKRDFQDVMEEAKKVLEENDNFTKLSKAQFIFESIKNGETLHEDRDTIFEYLKFYEERVKASDDSEFVTKSLKDLEDVWEKFKQM